MILSEFALLRVNGSRHSCFLAVFCGCFVFLKWFLLVGRNFSDEIIDLRRYRAACESSFFFFL